MQYEKNILENICYLLNKQNKTQKELTDHLGIHKNSFPNWKSGRSSSYTKYLPQIASFFGIGVDELLGSDPIICSNDLTAEEKTMITIYRSLSEEGRMRMIQAIMNIRDDEAKKRDTEDVTFVG